MKAGRNDPCPCGSGRKYKKCCYLKEQSAAEDAADYQEELDEQEFFSNLFTNLRMLTLKAKPHIKEYLRLRKMHSEIVDAMINYHESGKYNQKVDANAVHKAGSNVRLVESSFDLSTQLGGQAFYDMMLYKAFPNINCITEDFIQKHRYRKPNKIQFLHSMLDSRLGLFEITKTDLDEGCVSIREVFSGAEYTIIDVGLSGNRNNDEIYIYTRIITFNGISFGTGLNLVFEKTDNFIQKHIKNHEKDYNPDDEFLRFTQLYSRYALGAGKFRVVTNSLK